MLNEPKGVKLLGLRESFRIFCALVSVTKIFQLKLFFVQAVEQPMILYYQLSIDELVFR